MVPVSRRDGDFQRLLSGRGIGIIATWFAAGVWIYTKAAHRDQQRDMLYPEAARLKQDDKTAND
jgi:hypothetical protein